MKIKRNKLNIRFAKKLIHIKASKDRRAAGPTAPAQGLYLKQVYYNMSEIRFSENHNKE